MPETHKANSSLNQSMSSGAETEKPKKQKIIRTKCFFDMEFNKHPVGRIIFELHNDFCPKTCENFRSLCTGERGLGMTTNRRLYYKGTSIHRVVKNFMIQGGDFSEGDGTGGESVYGGCFADEYLNGKHDKAFLLSMANRGKDTNGSQFFITTAPAPHLDGKHVIFGHVVQGQEIIKLIENMPTNDQDRPLTNVDISHCGELIIRIKKKKRSKSSSSSSSNSASSSSSESDNESGGKKKKSDKENVVGSQESEVAKSNEQDVEFCTVRPEEVPPVPENKFLKRRTDGPANILVERKRSRSRDSHRDAAGRKVKGRGILRYSGKNRSRSRTPPLWRRVANERRNLTESRDREKNFRNYENFVREKREPRPSSPRGKRSNSRDQTIRKSKSLSPKLDKSRERSRDKKRSKSHERAKEENWKNGQDKTGDQEKTNRKRSKSRERNKPILSRNSSRERYSRRSRRKRSRPRDKSSSGSRASRSHSKSKSNRRNRSRSRD